MQLSKCSKLTQLEVATVAGTSDITPTYDVDMANFDGCMFFVPFGTITGSAVTSIKLQASSDDGSTDGYSDLEGTSVTIADSQSGKVAYIDIFKPRKRYLRLIVDRGTANAVVGAILALQYAPRVQPTTHDSTTVISTSETHISPAEGTA